MRARTLIRSFLVFISIFGLWLAASLKIASLSGWHSYLEKAGIVPVRMIPAFGLTIICLEILFPLLALIPRVRKLGGILTALLYAVFAGYHFVKLMTGEFTSCGCFGSALDLPTTPMLFLTSGLTLATIFGFRLHEPLVEKFAAYWRSTPKAERSIALVCGVLTIGVLTFMCARQVIAMTTPKRVLQFAGHAQKGEFDMAVPWVEGTRRKRLIAIVDYKCPYSREMLKALPQYAHWYGFPVSVIINPVIDPKGESLGLGAVAMSAARRGEFANENVDLLQAAEMHKTLGEIDASHVIESDFVKVENQQKLGQRWGQRKVPILLGVSEDGSVFVLSSGLLLDKSIERFASLKVSL